MALDFAGTTGDYVDHGSDSSLDDLAEGTLLIWGYKNAFGTGNFDYIYNKGAGGNRRIAWFDQFSDPDQLAAEFINIIGRKIMLSANLSTLSNYSTGKWICFGFTYNANVSTAAEQILFTGDLSNLVAEPSSYSSQANIAQSTSSDAATNLIIGNDPAGNLNFDGLIAQVILWNKQLSLAEIQAQQFSTKPVIYPQNVVLFSHYGFNGTDTQPDWSGNGNNGTVTGATVADHVPLGPAFGYDSGLWMPAAAAGSSSISPSASISPSPSAGYTGYTRGDEVSLPTDDADLETNYSGGDVTDVATKNDVRVDQNSTAEYAIHQYNNFLGTSTSISVEWEGQSNTAGTWSTIYLQVYNRDTPGWETLDNNNSVAADTDFSLTGNVADLTNYKDASNVVSFRIYQLAV